MGLSAVSGANPFSLRALQVQGANTEAANNQPLPLVTPAPRNAVATVPPMVPAPVAPTLAPAPAVASPRSQADVLNQYVKNLSQQAVATPPPAATVVTAPPAATASTHQHSALPKAVTEAYIVLDPGHGGKDPGAVANGVKEGEINLAVAQKVAKLLKEKGFTNVKLTREKDEFLELKEIPKIANDFFATAKGNKTKRFISIHHNSSPNTKVKGVETYYSEKNKAYTRGQDAGTLFSQNLYEALIAGLPKEQQRGNRAKDFQVLQGNKAVQNDADTSPYKPQAPTTLLELGYVSNPDEAKALADPVEQEKKARQIVDGLLKDLQEQVGQATVATASKTPSKPPEAKTGKSGKEGGKKGDKAKKT